ncbi:hypothetical protein ARMSODRAFT_1025338 [Armillaria solidipes]|uniref:Ubiquitin 3 binding protein But2 C-terminal domain-containing protein n=1 Tax=Armillaria solidipes TaxID=1076256 RepID=A0A2H3ASP4_9AGAR|nr:hypothetical protein ARMSODRAFT_1025338 [Armillaria solidipes]
MVAVLLQRNRHQYVALDQVVSEAHLFNDSSSEILENDRPKYTPCYPPMTWTYYIFILCTIIDCVAVIILATLRSGVLVAQTTISPDDLPLRNAYTNLDKLYQDHPSSLALKTPIYNPPLLVGQVSRYELDRVFPQPVEVYAEKNTGYSRLVYQHYLLSDQVTTIVQFRTRDYGLENCTFAFKVPSPTPDSFESPAIANDQNVLNDVTSIKISTIPVNRRLRTKSLSWRSVPSARIHVGSLNISTSGLTVEGSPFYCPSGAYLTFELSCVHYPCHLDLIGELTPEFGTKFESLLLWRLLTVSP